jgi:hypothetical protein
MMVINDVMPVLWAKDHGYHVFAEKFFTFLSTFITPMLAFGLNLTHADGNLGWTKVQYGDGLKTRFTDSGHVRFLPRRCANIERAIGDSEVLFWNFADTLSGPPWVTKEITGYI